MNGSVCYQFFLSPSGVFLFFVFFLGGGGGYFIYYCVFKILEVLYNFRCRFFVYLEQINALCCLYNYVALVYGVMCERKE